MLKRILFIIAVSLFVSSAFSATDAAPSDATSTGAVENTLKEKSPTININTTAFLDQGALPVLYTCDGKDISPEISWDKLPTNTKSLALLMLDNSIEDKAFYHWIVFNIPPKQNKLTQGITALPSGAILGKNSMDKTGYNGPCPPKGSAHTYTFTLYALDTTLTLPNNATGQQVMDAMKTHIIGKGSIAAVYSRWLQ